MVVVALICLKHDAGPRFFVISLNRRGRPSDGGNGTNVSSCACAVYCLQGIGLANQRIAICDGFAGSVSMSEDVREDIYSMLTMQYMDVADSFAKNSVSSLVIPSAGGKQAIKNSTEMRLRGCGGPEKRGVRNGAFQPGGMAKTSPPPPARTTPVAAKTIPLVPNFSTTFDSSKSTGRETPGVAARYVMHARMSAFAWVPFRLADESRVRLV
jgi:hypothetical protein